jgi:hypothetical protein
VSFSCAVAAPENTMLQAAVIKITKLRIPVFVTFSSHLVVTSRSLRLGPAIAPTSISAGECPRSKPAPNGDEKKEAYFWEERFKGGRSVHAAGARLARGPD